MYEENGHAGSGNSAMTDDKNLYGLGMLSRLESEVFSSAVRAFFARSRMHRFVIAATLRETGNSCMEVQ